MEAETSSSPTTATTASRSSLVPRAGSTTYSVAPHGAAPAEGAVDRPRYANREAAETPAECLRVVSLDDQMHVIILHAEQEHPEAAVGGRGESTADRGKDPAGPQAPDGRPSAQGDVQRVRGGVRRPGTVRHARAAARGELPPGAGSPAAPGAGAGRESCRAHAIADGRPALALERPLGPAVPRRPLHGDRWRDERGAAEHRRAAHPSDCRGIAAPRGAEAHREKPHGAPGAEAVLRAGSPGTIVPYPAARTAGRADPKRGPGSR